MSAAQRACLGADILSGEVVLTDLTVKAVCDLVGCSQPYVSAALRLPAERRAAVYRGERPLIYSPVQVILDEDDMSAIADIIRFEPAFELEPIGTA
jgi:hypothetical protein